MKQYILYTLTVLSLTACSASAEKKAKTTGTSSAGHFELATVVRGGISAQLKLPAQLAAYQEVSIFPKVNGYVKSVRVDIGAKVHKGDLLMTLDAPELEQASLRAKEEFEQSKAAFNIDEERYRRLQEAARTEGAISPMDLSTSKAKVNSGLALSNARKNNWQMQQTMLSYLNVRAPFSGVITQRNVSVGTLVSASETNTPMLELKEVDHLRLQIDIPETMAPALNQKDTVHFYVSALPGERQTGFISRKSMNVDPRLRSERVEIDIPNKAHLLSPGMYADVVIDVPGSRNSFRLPQTAVVTSTERKYVLAERNGRTTKIDVSTGNSSNGAIEVFGNLQPGEKVIAQANDEIEEGITVTPE
ncbi:efflux RND transporter periplasmic adaptor subunit [Niabella beijingensis]|uniref:efflux RND transporter periplasmic adaptor subunit n=1 Tax=Niabella beijingensis TaxID=2872700 RepID=UPI001CBFED06|nr:efflux RND transporter periplasmic adaptor subunit [Niabella beijingensis]MBZ4190368.1 efflux RND transporter periplasmic adaptor subunit [Niabella beijingensis]